MYDYDSTIVKPERDSRMAEMQLYFEGVNIDIFKNTSYHSLNNSTKSDDLQSDNDIKIVIKLCGILHFLRYGCLAVSSGMNPYPSDGII